MKVLMLGNDASVKGGITSVISQLLKYEWKKDGIEMDFIPTYIEANTFGKIIFFIKSYIKVVKRILVDKPDVLHIHMSYKGSFVRTYMLHVLCNMVGLKKIIHLHGSEFSKWYYSCNVFMQKNIRRVMRSSEVFIVLGKEWESRIKEIEPETRVMVVNNTVPIPSQMCSWNSEKKVILFLGVLIQRKGLKELFDAIALLKKKEKLPESIEVIVAGSGKEEENLKEQVKNLKLDDVVRFIGWIGREQKEELFLKSNMLVLPSYNEGLPMVVLEAMSYGVPIIASDVGDLAEAVLQGENGFLVKAGDVQELAETILRLLELGERQWESYSKKSRMITETKFSDEQYKDIFVKLYGMCKV